jgi:hypothetical protein
MGSNDGPARNDLIGLAPMRFDWGLWVGREAKMAQGLSVRLPVTGVAAIG